MTIQEDKLELETKISKLLLGFTEKYHLICEIGAEGVFKFGEEIPNDYSVKIKAYLGGL